MSAHLSELRRRADASPADVQAQLEAGYACDREGLEAKAIHYYDRVRTLGVPEEAEHTFLVAYGSTLRNVGRHAESVSILREAIDRWPEDRAIRCFLALALHSAGRHDGAVAELLGVALSLGEGVADLTPWQRALSEYETELLMSAAAEGADA